ncbi:adenylylsulfatase HINT3-like isoform X2 [Salvia splendens]|uniref:adenylylsulfatase HINT3-like isoform X2 n=1 Tax=Salvia splendens TaxID=180675 RepID=UPI001C27C056|nr:adenylylsulfatase HINT3-like isoform X2 [Salvia splendens]
MEARARRRLALLSSHVNPLIETSGTASFSSLIASACNGGNEMKKGEDDCVFCRIVHGQDWDFFIWNFPFKWKNIYTFSRHSLIIPKSHYPSLDATPPSIIGAMCSKVPLISNAVMKVTGCDSFNLLVNNGAAAGQVIYHTHIHIIPRKANDCLWTSESIRRCPMDQEVSQLADRIRESLMFVSRYEDSKGQGSSLVVN